MDTKIEYTNFIWLLFYLLDCAVVVGFGTVALIDLTSGHTYPGRTFATLLYNVTAHYKRLRLSQLE